MEFVIGGIVVLVIWFFVSMNKNANAAKAYNVIDEADEWFEKHNIKPSSTMFSMYDEAGLSSTPNAFVVVGSGSRKDDDRRESFALEIIKGEGVKKHATFIIKPGVVTYHKKAAVMARQTGDTLIGALRLMEMSQ